MTMHEKMTSKPLGAWANNPNTQTLKASTEASNKNIMNYLNARDSMVAIGASQDHLSPKNDTN